MKTSKHIAYIILALGILSNIQCNSQEKVYDTANKKVTGLVVLYNTDYLTVSEAGSSDTYDIVLSRRPNADVTIGIATMGQLLINQSADPLNLTFTAENWSLKQTLTINAKDDLVYENTHSGTISHTVSSADEGFNNTQVEDLSVFIEDNDTAGVDIVESAGETRVIEGSDYPDIYTIRLTSEPKAEVEIEVEIDTDNQNKVVVNGDGTFSYFFKPGDWYVKRTISVLAFENSEPITSGVIKHNIKNGDDDYKNLVLDDINVTIQDNDNPGLIISKSEITITEDGETATYSVRLATQITNDVTVEIHTDVETGVNDPATGTLTFNSGNWNTQQDVTIFAVDDSDEEGLHHETIEHTAVPDNPVTDPGYDIPNDDSNDIYNVTANIIDNDMQDIILTRYTFDLTEGETGYYEISLAEAPTSAVQIDIEADDQTLVNDKTKYKCVFDSTNFDIPQGIEITVIDDTLKEGNHISVLTHSIRTNDIIYKDAVINDVTVNITDND